MAVFGQLYGVEWEHKVFGKRYKTPSGKNLGGKQKRNEHLFCRAPNSVNKKTQREFTFPLRFLFV